MPQQIDLNVSPYYDDYDEADSFYQVLFKPGVPVQARELTTSQSILQNQIKRFGDHIFKEGARVTGGEVSYNGSQPVVIVNETFEGLFVEGFLPFMRDVIIKGRTSLVRAKIKFYISALTSIIDKPSIYIDYISPSPNDPTITTFLPGEILELESLLTLGALDENPNLFPGDAFATVFEEFPISLSNFVTVDEGIFYIKGRFIKTYGTRLILDQYTNTNSYKVGFFIDEQYINSDQSEGLLDNSKGFNNFAAPGADRLKINLILTKIPIDVNLNNFILLKEIRNGVDISQPFTTEYSELAKEFARRTFDESGDYYVKPPVISVRETLNDLKGNNGIFKEGTSTYFNNTPSESLATYVISPLKAYVRGYEIQANNSTYLDFEKPRTTKTLQNQQIIYNTGSTFSVNRVYGSPTVGIGNTYFIRLSDSRVGDTQNQFSGKEIGLARVYDFSLEAGSYNLSNQDINEWNISLYDVQTYTEITLNEPITLSTPTRIKGRSSGATAFLRHSVSSSGIITAYNTSGNFSIGETFTFDGIPNSRIAVAVTSYGLKDVKSLYGVDGSYTFSGDIRQQPLFDVGSATISGESSGISTVTSPNFIFETNVRKNDLVAFTSPGDEIPTFSKVENVFLNRITISGVTTVSGICEGQLPNTTINVSDFRVLTSELQQSEESKLYTRLPKQFIESVDLTNSNLTVRQQFNVTITSNSTNIIDADVNEIFLPFDEERYTLIREDGVTEPLSRDKFQFLSGGSQLRINGLGTNSSAKLTATLQKVNPKSKVKIKNSIKTIVVDKSINSGSGIGGTTLNNGLTFGNYPYGTRVEDDEICLLEPDVTKIYAIFESNTTNDPNPPSLVFSNLNGPTNSTSDLIIGEEFVGSISNAVGILVRNVTNLSSEFVNLNSNSFAPGETVEFKNSKIQATVSSINSGDRNITDKYTFDPNQKNTIYDYSRLIRKRNVASPDKKIKIIFQSASFGSSDSGDLITVNSYRNFDYCSLVNKNNFENYSDIIDIRPRVSNYIVSEGERSPFEFLARIFNQSGNSVSNILASGESFLLNYSFYLPRIDRIFLTNIGTFQLNNGEPAEFPKKPSEVEDGLEIASIYLPPYLCDLQEVTVDLVEHKRYRMTDIRKLERRIENLEYYTSLSLLESNTASLQIKDSNGLDRFKSGFFVDDFSSTINQKKVTIVKNSIDITQAELRPSHYTTSVDLILGNSSILGESNPNIDFRTSQDVIGTNVRKTGQLLTLDYDEVVEISQPFSSKVVKVVPYTSVFYGGGIDLIPSSDIWVDQIRLEPKTVETEGNYTKTLAQEDFDPQTGFSPVVWDSWETNWTGSFTNTRTKQRNVQTSRGTKVYLDTIRTTTKTGVKTRTGEQKILKEQIDNVSFGDSVLNVQVIPYCRSRNIEFTSKRLKPFTTFYSFFDGVDFNQFVFPKLIEIEMISGVFSVGERVKGFIEGNINTTQSQEEKTIFFRVAKQNHKYGSYDSPSDIYTINPYNQTDRIPENYLENSTLINVDTFSLSNQPQGLYYGYIHTGMKLIGETSGAEARVTSVRLVSDNVGTLIGSFFIPNPNIEVNPKFEAGDNIFRITTNSSNTQIIGSVDSSAEEIYYSEGSINTVQENVILIRNAKVETVEKSESQNVRSNSSSTSSILLRTIPPPPPPTPSYTPPTSSTSSSSSSSSTPKRYEGFAFGTGTPFSPAPFTGATGLINQNAGGSQSQAFAGGTRPTLGLAALERARADGYSDDSVRDWIRRTNAGVGCKASISLGLGSQNCP